MRPKLVNQCYPEQLLPLTFWVGDNEPCYGVVELNLPAPGFRAARRYRIFLVIRADRLHEYREDLGLARSVIADQLRIPGGVETPNGKFLILHTVGELRGLAEEWHAEYAIDREQEPIKPHDLNQLLYDFKEAKAMVHRGQKTF